MVQLYVLIVGSFDLSILPRTGGNDHADVRIFPAGCGFSFIEEAKSLRRTATTLTWKPLSNLYTAVYESYVLLLYCIILLYILYIEGVIMKYSSSIIVRVPGVVDIDSTI